MLAFGEYPSPNSGPRRNGALPDLIVLHYTAMENEADAKIRLCSPEAEVSAHYLISEQGAVQALVPEELRAWHAGAGQWGACSDVNSRSIGVELANRGDEPFPDVQIAALETLLRDLMARWQIPPERVIGHSDMAPGRKSDPGRWFDWQRLARQGLSVWPGMAGAEAGSFDTFRQALRVFGYPDAADDILLQAFRLRFRPSATGPLGPADIAMAEDLAARFPVDAHRAAA